MRWRYALLGLMLLAPSCGAHAANQVNGCGRYEIWTPDNWKVTFNKERLEAESPDNEITLVVAPVEDRAADLLDEDVIEFIDDEIDAMKVTSDRREKIGGLEARILEGVGKDNNDAVSFKAVAFDPGGNAGLIEMIVYGDPAMMNRRTYKAIFDQMLGSFKPQQ
ncbi:MAG TPA: hypothetical protein VEH76_07845 [Methylocystis sp.]|nr:hypothetical protein [Methylocystis sp.]